MDDLMDIDIYELMDIPSTADEKMIKKAYRKKALTCHPDKNPDNPRAAALFLELSKALELLLDQVKRASYDKLYNAKKAAKIRNQELDSRRRKLKEDLEIRERLAQCDKTGGKTREQKLSEEIERLRKQGSQQLKEEMESIRQQIYNESLLKPNVETAQDGLNYRLKIKWKSEKNDSSNGGYNTENLQRLFSKYGNVSIVIVSQKKKGSALIEFEKSESALKAYQLEKGYLQNPLKLTWLNGEPPSKLGTNHLRTNNHTNKAPFSTLNETKPLFPSMHDENRPSQYSSPKPATCDTDFEAFVFAKLREAEEKKKHDNT